MALVNAALTASARTAGRPLGPARATGLLVYRNFLVYRRGWWIFVTGFLEPLFYLFSIGIGVGKLIHGFEFNGAEVAYRTFVAPGMIATSAMNGTLLDATFNFYFKLRYNKLYDQMLATPLTTMDIARGELTWSLLRGGVYAAVFLLVMVAMGLVASWWAVLVVPAALLIGLAFGALGMALTTWMRTWQDFEYVTLLTMPMFLFSATFFPITAFPTWLRWVVECTPLYRGVALCRELSTGLVTWASLVSVAYLVVIGVLGLVLVDRRLDRLLLT